jgi:hypothetical protein
MRPEGLTLFIAQVDRALKARPRPGYNGPHTEP